MASVTRKPAELRITDAQHVGSSLLVSFDDGVEAPFEPRFLYHHKQTNETELWTQKKTLIKELSTDLTPRYQSF